MIDFSGSSQQSQGGDSQDDPLQEMIRRAMAVAKAQPASTGQPTGAADSTAPPADRGEQLSLGERIGKKTSVAPVQAAQPSPSAAVDKLASRMAAHYSSGAAPGEPLPPPVGGSAPSAPASVGTNDTQPISFGARLAAKSAVVQPAAPSAPSPESVAPLSATPPAAATANLGGPVPAAPVGSNNPNRVALLKQQAELGNPLDKTDPKYKMGWGQRLLGVAANFGAGLNHQGPVEYIGPGATNRRYETEETKRKAQLENVGTQLEGQEKLDTSNLNLEKQAQRSAYEDAMAAARGETAKAQMERAQTYGELSDTRGQLNLALAEKAGQPQEPKTEAEIALALQTAKIKGDKQGVMKYQGSLDELAKQKKAGREPKDTTAGDIAKAIQVAEFRSRRLADLDKEQDKERQQRYAELDKNEFDPDKIATKKAQVDQELQTKYAPKAQDIHDQADQMLGLTKAGAKLTSSAGKIPPKPTTAPPAGKVWVYDKRTGKRGAIPSGQLGIATRGANAQYGAW